MPIDINEARSLVEAARKRGLIRAPGDAPARLESKEAAPNRNLLPDWLQEAIETPPALPD